MITSKLCAPALRRNTIRRLRLNELLNQSFVAEKKLSLLVAPAGFGKTSLVCDWLQHADVRFAWLSLDPEDRETTRFLAYLIAALQSLVPEMKAWSDSLLHKPFTTEEVLGSVVNLIAKLDDRCVLVIDDYHFAETKENNEVLSFLLAHLSSQLHLVILSRQEVHAPIARFRALNQVIEIGARELTLNEIEVVYFLTSTIGLHLSPAQIEHLKTHTEGWVAGLQLATAGMAACPKNLESDLEPWKVANQYVIDFIFEEIISPQVQVVQDFLIATASLQKMNSSLCDFVLEDLHVVSCDILNYLQRENLFVLVVDTDHVWFRYHRQFHDALKRLQERRLSPTSIAKLHLRASTWYEHHADLNSAFYHVIAAGDMTQLAHMAEKYWEELASEVPHSQWLEWVKNLPEELVARRPVLCVQIAWSWMSLGNFDASEMRLRDAEVCMQNRAGEMSIVVAEQYRHLQGRIAFVRAFNAQLRQDFNLALRNADLVLHLANVDRDAGSRGQSRTILSLSYCLRGDLDQAQQLLLEAIESARRTGNYYKLTISAFEVGQLLTQQGQLKEAMCFFQKALQYVAEHQGDLVKIAPQLLLGCAMISLETGDQEALESYLDQAVNAAVVGSLPDWQFHYHLVMAQIKASAHEWSAALSYLDGTECCLNINPLLEIRSLDSLRMSFLLQQGEIQSVKSWLRSKRIALSDEVSYLLEFEHLLLVRTLLAEASTQGESVLPQEVDLLLARLLSLAEMQNRVRSQIEILKLKALIQDYLGNRGECLRLIKRLLVLAKPECWSRIFMIEGQSLQTLLQAFKMHDLHNANQSACDAHYLDSLIRPSAFTLTKTSANFYEPLSQRELSVLKLIAEGHSNEEICTRLFLAIDTVKGHNRRIFNKLQVRRRTEAVVKAHKLGLI